MNEVNELLTLSKERTTAKGINCSIAAWLVCTCSEHWNQCQIVFVRPHINENPTFHNIYCTPLMIPYGFPATSRFTIVVENCSKNSSSFLSNMIQNPFRQFAMWALSVKWLNNRNLGVATNVSVWSYHLSQELGSVTKNDHPNSTCMQW